MAGKRQERRGLTPGEALAVLLPLSAAIFLLDPFEKLGTFLLGIFLGAGWAFASLGIPPFPSWAALLPALGGSAGAALAAFLGEGNPGRTFLEVSARALPLCFFWTWTFRRLSLPLLAGWIRTRTGLRLLPEVLITFHRMLALLTREAGRKRRALQARAPRIRRGIRVKSLLHLTAALAGSVARRSLQTGRAMDARGYRGEIPLPPPEEGPFRIQHMAVGVLLLLLLLTGLSW